MKRILCITENLGSGGAERQLCYLAALLKENGFDVLFITYLENQFYEEYLRENGVDYKLDKTLRNRYTRCFALKKIVNTYKPDALISYLPSANQAACLLRFFYKGKIIVSERSHTDFNGLTSYLRYLLYALSTRVVANSFSETDNIRSHCPWLKKKIVAIPNCVDTEFYTPRDIQNSVFTLVCVGRVIPSKNILRLIEAAKLVQDKCNKPFVIKWFGSTYNQGYYQECTQRINDLNLEKTFFIENQIRDIRLAYQSGDAFCLPSLLEGYPNVICEAMSCGLPVICSNNYDNPTLIQNKVNGYMFDPYLVSEIAEAVIKMLELPKNERDLMGARNRDKVIGSNSKTVFVHQYMNLLK